MNFRQLSSGKLLSIKGSRKAGVKIKNLCFLGFLEIQNEKDLFPVGGAEKELGARL